MGMAHLKRGSFRRATIADWADRSKRFPTLVQFSLRCVKGDEGSIMLGSELGRPV